MARKLIGLFVFVIVFSISASSVHGRRLMMKEQNHSNNNAQTTTFDRLYLVALPKSTVPPSAPSKKGHSFTVDEKLVARHLGSVNRILGSVPAPGIGN